MSSTTDPIEARGVDTRGLTLRQFAAHGVIVNSAFDVLVGGLGLIRGIALAAILSRSDYGIWGILVATLGVLARLKLIGINDKYVQQNEGDQELAFQKAFTLELAMSLGAMVVVAGAVPIVALIYGHWSLLAPGLVLVSVLLADAMQSPMWIYYRRMEFVRQRWQTVVEPAVGLVLAVTLALLGLGYWALAIGVTAGAWSGALVAVVMSPYKLRWRYDRGALKIYGAFGWPILAGTVSSIVLANGAVLATNIHLGLKGVGALAVCANITAFTTRVDDLVANTIFPAICAIQDRLELLRESFVKTNRLALLWAMPFGIGVALFAPDLIRFVIGEKWARAPAPATTLLEIYGVVAALNHIGFNWDDYYRARGTTKPVLVATVAPAFISLLVGVPLLFDIGLTGLAIGVAVGALVAVLIRAIYVRRLFDGFAFIAHAWRAILPTLPAAIIVLIISTVISGHKTLLEALGELVVYGIAVLAGSWLFERELILELIAYARRPSK
jgi:O-antigen/teichoic acid export membrane protein